MPTRPKHAIDREVRFDLEELFFSSTDKTGRILFGNDVFRRVSGYDLDDMIGEPHSLVRHPDMPRVVFQMLWDYLEQGKPIAAYVKNISSDGSYYWVITAVLPVPGSEGYLSVRLKPTSEMFPLVQEAYRQLREVEIDYESRGDKRGGLEASMAELPKILYTLGFQSYDEFMRAGLSTEIGLRAHALNAKAQTDSDALRGRRASSQQSSTLGPVLELCERVDKLLARQYSKLDGFIDLSSKLEEKSRFVRGLAKTVRLVSLNAMAASGRLSTAGAPLGVIAQAIGTQAEESGELAGVLEKHNAQAAVALTKTAFLLSTAKIQMEMLVIFLRELLERESAGEDIPSDSCRSKTGLDTLATCLIRGVEQFFASYAEVIDELEPLMSDLAGLRRLVQILDITHVTGMVESGRLPEAKGFDALFEQVGRQVKLARVELRDFSDSVEDTSEDIGILMQQESKIMKDLGQVANIGEVLGIEACL